MLKEKEQGTDGEVMRIELLIWIKWQARSCTKKDRGKCDIYTKLSQVVGVARQVN